MDTEHLQRRIRAHALAAEAAITLCAASARLRTVPRGRLVTVLGEPEVPAGDADERPATATPGQLRRGRRVGRMVERVAGLLPWHPVCLPQALATQWMLERRRVPSVLHLGVADARSMDAHAWVTVGARKVVGRVAQPYAPVAAFPGRCAG